MARILIKNLTKRFGKVVAVNDLSLEVKDGEFLVLLGPSGCGKTTILRCIAGLEKQDEGEIYVGDTLINDLPPKERDVAMVFQSYALYPHMTAYDNIAFPLKVMGVAKVEIDERIKKVAELLRISHLLDRKPKQLSGGEAQRVALGRALIREPKAFLMDEPLSNLDAKLRIYMRAELKKLQKDLEITTIYVTHDQVEAMTMADRVALLNQGKLQQVGLPEELYHRPNNLFTAGFIGSPPMNFIECKITRANDKIFLDADVFKLPLENQLAEVLKERYTNKSVVLGVRPEDILLDKGEKKGFIQSEVFALEPLGNEVIVNLKLGETIFKAKENAEFRAKVGDKLWFAFKKEKLYVFDKETGSVL